MTTTAAGRWWRGGALALLVLVGGGRGGEAQEPPPVAAAEALFRAGTALMVQGKASEACPRLEESFRLDPAGSTAQALGRCYELTGRKAAAWARYTVALSFARRRNRPDREQELRAHLAELEARLAWLKVTVAPEVAQLPSVKLSLDGEALGPGSWGVELPADPGPHRLLVEAPGRLARSLPAELREGQHDEVVVDRLDEAPHPVLSAAPSPPPSAPSPVSSDRATSPLPSSPPQPLAPPPALFRPRDRLALGLGAAGLGLSVLGGVLVVRATAQASEAQSLCFPTCDEGGGTDRYRQSLSTRRWAAAALAGGGALVAAGVVLFATGERQVQAAALPGGAGASVSGRF